MAARSIAAAQTIPIRGDVDANLERHVRLARLAAEERAEVLVFPELSLTGYELDLADELAFSARDPRLAPLVELASSCRMTLVVRTPRTSRPTPRGTRWPSCSRTSADPVGGLPAAGSSAIWSERGELLAQLPRSGSGVVVASEEAAGWRASTIELGG